MICKTETGHFCLFALREFNFPSVTRPVTGIMHSSEYSELPSNLLLTYGVHSSFLHFQLDLVGKKVELAIANARIRKSMDWYSIWLLHPPAFTDHEHYYVCGRCSFLAVQIFELNLGLRSDNSFRTFADGTALTKEVCGKLACLMVFALALNCYAIFCASL